MRIVASNYNGDCIWIPILSNGDYLIYDRTGCGMPKEHVREVENIGNADYDKLTYLIDNYDNLPPVFMLIKSNLFKYISIEEFYILKDRKEFTPLLTMNHKTYEPVCRYEHGIYWERNDSWYVSQFESNFSSYNDWANYLGLPIPEYLPFAPGGNYILTPKEIHKWPKEFYEKIRDTLGYTTLPAEAHMLERSYYMLWSK